MSLVEGEENTLADELLYPAYKIEALTRFMANEGVNPESTLANTGLSNSTLSLPETRISMRQLATVYTNISHLSNDPAIALHAGQQIHVSNYGLFGYAILTSTSLRRALEFATNKYHRLATPTVTMSLNEYGDVASLSFLDTLGMEEINRFNLEFQLSLLSSIHHDMLGPDFCWDSAHCSYSEPKHSHEYETILGCPVHFKQSKTELIFRKDILDQPLLKSNPITETMIKEMCGQLLIEQMSHTDLTRRIYDLLSRDPANMPSSENVAQSLAMSSRTMRRKLESQGTTLHNIVDQVRKNLSINFLRGTKMNIDDIAEQVGFSSAANFRTAFKRWTNKTPAMYRLGR